MTLKREQNDSASTNGTAWSIFGLRRSKGHSAGGKHKGFSFERWKLVNCCDVEADSLFVAGVFCSILSLNNNGRFVGDKHAGFSQGRDVCFEVDGERLIDLFSGGVKLVAAPLEQEAVGSCYSLPIFSALVPTL